MLPPDPALNGRQGGEPPRVAGAGWGDSTHKLCLASQLRCHCVLLCALARFHTRAGPTCCSMPWVFTYNDWSAGTEYDFMAKAAVMSAIQVPGPSWQAA